MPRPGQSLSSRYRTALVTGASSGLGAAIAKALLKEGLTVYGTNRNTNQEDLHPEVHWLELEAGDSGRMADWVKDKGLLLENIDILVNNCGGGVFGDAVDEDESTAASNRQLLLGTPVLLTRTVLPGMRERGGTIVNVSSLAAQFPLPYMAGYTAAKAGLSAFTQSLIITESGSAAVLIDFQPGDFRTAFNRNMLRIGEAGAAQLRAWKRMETLLAKAPSAEAGARDLVKALEKGKSGVVRSGSFFQKHMAPLGIRIFPRRFLLNCIRRYYKIDKG